MIFPEALSSFNISDLEGGVHGGGGLRVILVDAGYAGPEFRYEYPLPINRSDPPEM